MQNKSSLPAQRGLHCAYTTLFRKLLFLSLIALFLVVPTAVSSLFALPRPTKAIELAESNSSCKIIYAGFVGALETSNHKGSGVVQIRDTLRGPDYPDVCANSFIPISWTSGRDWILTHYPARSGVLTPTELETAPRIILVGHSTGGWAMLSVARELRDKNIPVELTVQIDSVGFNDSTIPRNVSTGAIFHAWDALALMTTKHLRLEDPLHTKLIADIVVQNASHLSITRDPRIRLLVMNAVANLRQQSPLSRH